MLPLKPTSVQLTAYLQQHASTYVVMRGRK